MQTFRLTRTVLSLFFLFLLTSAFGQTKLREEHNVQFSIFSNLQVVEENESIYGFRFTVPYGVNKDMIGFDMGAWSETHGYQYGFQGNCLVAYHGGDADGFNFAGLVNYTDKNSSGCVIGLIYSVVRHRITGFQAGLVVKARQVSGVQFSLLNYCEDLDGFQIGLINIHNNGMLPFTILLNYGNNKKSK